ncbi:heat-inducible transcription repressor HrcA [Bryocella elongata]|uniref:Heat-inducible transcription repressor HrcA n=1 Tax=Bryocella elongata TaxID=863522 RepID=A0A1H5X1I7_9BACT|nr:heat-inducible transcriptional repressor HrcA [Bryocella elongata]SEG05662.1 heat-inducible transcription repressor HrcA [Bryocella elongata]
MSGPLTTRQREILIAIVEQYIETGEPVSSGTLAHVAFDHAMSSATIRNEMASLADAGLLDQPHTSAGRIPSAAGFRLYVSQLKVSPTTAQLAGQAEVRSQLRSQIDSQFAGVAGANALLECTSQVLAALSSGVGFAIGASTAADLLEHVHFSRLAPSRILAVVVTRSGMVRDRVLALSRDLTPVELNSASNFLNEHFRGWNIERVRADLARRLETERHTYQELHDAIELWASAIPASASQPVVYLDGITNLLAHPQDRERLRALLAALEEKQRLVELLNAYIDARETSVRVVFDLEDQQPGMAGLVLVAAPARVADGSSGAVGVLAPRRMQYNRTIDAVGYVAEVFDRLRDPATP